MNLFARSKRFRLLRWSPALLLALSAGTLAARPSAPSTLPPPVLSALRAAEVPASSVSFWVMPLRADAKPLLTWQATQAMSPASTMKILTAWAALNLLGPDYQWTTTIATDGIVRGRTLHGDLYLRGSGDPSLMPEVLAPLLAQLRTAGIDRLDGDLVVDTSAYSAAAMPNTTSFDGDDQKSYNVMPHPLAYAFKTLDFHFAVDDHAVAISVKPPFDGLIIDNQLKIVDTRCADLEDHAAIKVTATPSGRVVARFVGAYSRQCGERDWFAAVLDPNTFFRNGFVALWQRDGGTFAREPAIRDGTVPAGARVIATQQGAPLAQILTTVNKYSNNLMARQVFLTLGAADGSPADPRQSATTVANWLQTQQLAMPELVLDNGSGLSRSERISTQHLGRVLVAAATQPLGALLKQSLPQAGVDGTMRRRLRDRGDGNEAWIKTGTLSQVRAIAGYVDTRSGGHYVVVSLINDPHAAQAQAVHDALLQWLFDKY